ncbi:type II toxin-antitoxin system HigB family toxin [Dyadobacter sp.]|uniref:type II toxin-antitoxin system HigB family toxin n=1 Tax=Dyadobacter sp. TaxID=1914288 RepID=UPI003F721D74
MVIISYRAIREFGKRYPDALEALNVWHKIVEKANWSHFHEVREVFNSIDAVGNDRYVFNIKGNKYRLVALIKFNIRTLYILFIGTHAEYDKIDASTIHFKRK